jgi:hypothetical protein
MPADLDAVVRDLVAARLAHVMERGAPLHRESVGFWNALTSRA